MIGHLKVIKNHDKKRSLEENSFGARATAGKNDDTTQVSLLLLSSFQIAYLSKIIKCASKLLLFHGPDMSLFLYLSLLMKRYKIQNDISQTRSRNPGKHLTDYE